MYTNFPRRAQLAWRALAVASALAVIGPCYAAPARAEAMPLRLVSTDVRSEGEATVVQARVARSQLSRVLSPRVLRVAIVSADGTVRAEQRRVVGPAQLPRGNTRDAYLGVRLPMVPRPDERIVAEIL